MLQMSKRHHIALCDFEQNEKGKVYSQINNDCNETSCNFISPANKVLLQTAIVTVENNSFQYRARTLSDNGSQSSYITPKLCEKLNLKSITSRDVTIKVFVKQILQEKLDYVRVYLKSIDNEDIVTYCLVKDICHPLHGQYILHAKQKFKHMKHLKLADSYSNNENLCVDILIGSDFLWNIFESEIIRGDQGTPIAMKTKFVYVLRRPMSKVHNNQSFSLECATEISDCESMEK